MSMLVLSDAVEDVTVLRPIAGILFLLGWSSPKVPSIRLSADPETRRTASRFPVWLAAAIFAVRRLVPPAVRSLPSCAVPSFLRDGIPANDWAK